MILQKGKSILSTLRFSMTFKTLSTYKFKHFALLLYGRMFYFSHLLQLPCNYFTASLQNFLREMLLNYKWTKYNMKNHNQEKSTIALPTARLELNVYEYKLMSRNASIIFNGVFEFNKSPDFGIENVNL